MKTELQRIVDILCRKFPLMHRHEIEQEIELAHLLTDDIPFVVCIARRRLTDQVRKAEVWNRHFASFDAPGFDGDLTRVDGDLLLERFFSDDEWSHVSAGLPYPAQKLAAIARRQAERFEDVPGGIWTRQNLTELRRRIKREFVAWQRDHSERAYFRARQTLVTALRRHRGDRV